MKYKDAIEYGVLSLELENYGDGFLRVVEFDESKEFCGGTHIENTSLIEKFKIIKIDSKGSGVFRIEAITSNKEIENYEKNEKIILIKKIKQKIIKNKKLNSTYSIKIPNNLNELKKLLIQINIDNKKLNINSKNNFDFDDQKICIKM
jgi:alanyl-tRNA synthetase